jgi:hypothetical protein
VRSPGTLSATDVRSKAYITVGSGRVYNDGLRCRDRWQGSSGGTAPSKLRFLCVIGAKLRTEVTTVGCPPKFEVAIAETERQVAERTAGGTRTHYISAARDHQIPLTE